MAFAISSPLFAIALSLLVAGILYFFYRLHKERSWYKGLPQPPSSYIWGHLKLMGEATAAFPPNSHPQLYYKYIAEKYNLKGLYYLDLWPLASGQVITLTPELMDQVTVTKPFKQTQISSDFLAAVVGRDVIATANGPVWKQLHKAMVPAFSWSHIRTLSGVMVEELTHFRNTLDGFSASGEEFLMEETSAKLIFDIIARVVFNVPLHAQTTGSSYLDDLREMVHLQEAQLSMSPLVKLKAAWRRRTIMARLNPAIAAQIKERLSLLRREQIVPSRKAPYSILDLMLRDLIETGGDELKGSNVDAIAPKYLELLITNMKGLLLGGHGTTTDSLCFCYMLLSKHPEVVAKLRAEHSKVFTPDTATTTEMLLDAPHKLQELDFTSAVIRETLRLFPIGFSLREANEGATVSYEGKDYPVDNGLVVVAETNSMHYDPTYFPEHTKFIPERFLEPLDPRTRHCFRTFSRGPRACLGQNLAMANLQATLLLTVRDYDFEFVVGAPCQQPNEKPRVGFTDLDTVYGEVIFQELGIEARPRGGMTMRVKRAGKAN